MEEIDCSSLPTAGVSSTGSSSSSREATAIEDLHGTIEHRQNAFTKNRDSIRNSLTKGDRPLLDKILDG
jgi:hypothetical protein